MEPIHALAAASEQGCQDNLYPPEGHKTPEDTLWDKMNHLDVLGVATSGVFWNVLSEALRV